MELSPTTNKKGIEELEEELTELEKSLPKQLWFGAFPMHLYQGFWCPALEATVSFQAHFHAHDTNVILTSLPKTGTTWLKSLLYAIVNRKNFPDISQHPLRTHIPHELVLFLEHSVYEKIGGIQPDFTKVSLPRLFATHIPYPSLPKSIKTSNCRTIYICRNPLDTFVASWHFYLKLEKNKDVTPNMMEDYLRKFCEGKFPLCPFEDHVLGYWKESIQNPQKVLFVEYEGLKEDSKAEVKRLAKFIGYPFSEEEEKERIIDEIIELCSLESLKEMEVNKRGTFFNNIIENNAFFRKGNVGDWKNYLTPSMVKQLNQMQEKLKRSGFTFRHYQPTII